MHVRSNPQINKSITNLYKNCALINAQNKPTQAAVLLRAHSSYCNVTTVLQDTTRVIHSQ